MNHFPTTQHSDRPSGDQAATHIEPARSESGALTSASVDQCAPEAVSRQPEGVKGPHNIPQAFERLNKPQMRRDCIDNALPPLWLMVFSAVVCLLTLLIADMIYPAFFLWLTGMPL